MAEGFANSVVGGAETLIRSAIKSFGYVAGIFGWRIARDGSAELNSATIRGSLSAGSGNVVVDNNGVHVIDIGGTTEYDINRTGGFIAKNNPDNGAHNQMYQAGMAITLPDPTPQGNTFTFGRFDAFLINLGGVKEAYQMDMVTGLTNAQDDANVLVRSESSDGSIPPYIQLDARPTGTIDLTALLTTIAHRLVSLDTGMDFPAAQMFNVNFTVTGNGNTGLVNANLGNTNYPVAFPVGRALFGYANNKSQSANSIGWFPRWWDVSNSQFNLNMVNQLGGAAGTYTLVINLVVFVLPA